MARPIGRNIVDVCLELDANGPRTAKQFALDCSGWNYEKSQQYLQRAVKFDFAARSDTTPDVYTVRPDWRKRIDAYGISEAKPMVSKPRPVIPAYVQEAPKRSLPASAVRNSIFDNGRTQ